jgi:hypothetical protein
MKVLPQLVLSETLQSELKKGDILKITTMDGKDFEFKIAEINSEAIIGKTEFGDNRQILFHEISKIEKTRPKPSKTFVLTSAALQLKKGDKVKITRKDGKVVWLWIDEISSEGIFGNNQQILFTEISKIETTRPSPPKTIALIVIPIVGALVILGKVLEGAGD